MKNIKSSILIFLFISLVELINGQENHLYHFSFSIKSQAQLNEITQIISIDNVKNNLVFAYANQKEFAAFKSLNIPYLFIQDTKNSKAIAMATTIEEMANWDKYPTYEVYMQLMESWANSYPDLCRLEEIGTLASGRKLLAIKISDNVENNNEFEPEIFLTSSIHGDELGGYVLSLRMIDYLLTNYSSDTTIQNLLNSTEIWINPLANPDGTYLGGNNSVSGSIRYNGNYIDLNRNFPDPAAGQNPDGNATQPETQYMMNFADAHHFSISLNIHGGAEVVNYPWDTWYRTTADDEWWKYVGGNYRDSAQANSPVGYLTDINNGLTLGSNWYRITGGRQDYMNYFKNCREFTLEISSAKVYPSENLPELWNYNKSALLGYFTEACNGIHGRVTNTHGVPLNAEIQILNHDKDHSEVFSELNTGYFFRYLKAGTYDLQIIADGYPNKVFYNIDVVDGKKTELQIVLCDSLSRICLQDSVLKKTMVSNNFDSLTTTINNCGNDTLTFSVEIDASSSFPWVSFNQLNDTLLPNSQQEVTLYFNPHENDIGTHVTSLHIISDTTYYIPLFLNVENSCIFQFSDSLIEIEALQGKGIKDSVFLKNCSTETKNFEFVLDKQWDWLTIDNSQGSLNAGDSIAIILTIDSVMAPIGFYENTLHDTLSNSIKLPIQIFCLGSSKLAVSPIFINKTCSNDSIYSDTIVLSNSGGEAINFEALFENTLNWMEVIPSSGTILKNGKEKLVLHINTNNQAIGKYLNQLYIETDNETIEILVSIGIDSLPKLKIRTTEINEEVEIGSRKKATIELKNMGGGLLNYELSANKNWVQFSKSTGQIESQKNKNIEFIIDSKELDTGNYSTLIFVNEDSILVEIMVIAKPAVVISPKVFYYETNTTVEISDSLTITNSGSRTINYQIQVNNSEQNPWIQAASFSGLLTADESKVIKFKIDPSLLTIGSYKGFLRLTTNIETKIPIELQVK